MKKVKHAKLKFDVFYFFLPKSRSYYNTLYMMTKLFYCNLMQKRGFMTFDFSVSLILEKF